jgi:hypothetical protein
VGGDVVASWISVTIALLAATPVFLTKGDVTPEAELRAEAEATWKALEARYVAEAGGAPARAPATLSLQRGEGMLPSRNGQGRPGVVELRQNTPGVLEARLRVALRHELAHQLLWWACPASAEDRLFHEAFALAVSGELAEWREAPYQSLASASVELARNPDVDTPRARRALARVLNEDAGFPRALTRRLRQCQDGARWAVPLSVEELAGVAVEAAASATVVLNRHSGEVLFAEGDLKRAMPYGSTLKPFVVAGSAAPPPVLPSRADVPEWSCGDELPGNVDVKTALLRSCNGYFLDWEGQGRAPPKAFGPWGPVLAAVGLSSEPLDMADAIGLRSTLRISPWGLAQAYRLLAEARPELMAVLADNAALGTLSELSVSKAFVGVATKTGTVRDAESRPRLGWIVAVDEELIAVVARPGKMPRSFANEVPELLAKVRRKRVGQEAARVQVLGLVASGAVEAQCQGVGFALEGRTPRAVPEGFTKLAPLVSKGAAVCLGSPWRVRFPEAPAGRDYAGVFSWSPPPLHMPPPGVPSNPHSFKARRGSDFLFRTTRLQYTAGVVSAEDASLTGEPRVALARVVAHNERHPDSRHPGRPLCDTTHCQTFLGTVRVKPEEERALGLPPPRWRKWLPFSQGGQTPWREMRSRTQVEFLLGQGVTGLRFAEGRMLYLRTKREGGAVFDVSESHPCELLRSALKLPACPQTATFMDTRVLFEGRGRGHGEGLDVEAAKASGSSHEQILERAYGQ